ncbi:MAG TPA: site-specific DNA-methyltransferase [Jatrophihabitans sp.]|jgi:DNA modification methylase|uniref:DNA-methyltransferase n=1 Tax=Jatrophihabitans sp. TaxID=1932789 RepID=UPI002EF3F3FF
MPPRNQVLVGDALTELRRLPNGSIDTVVTSPPYFRLRDYQIDGQLGLEGHVDEWVSGLRAVARQVQRCLVPTGSFWLNLADTYSTHPSQGAGRKSLVLGPERLALSLLKDGWLLRNKIIWTKANSMPSSVRDRLTCRWEAVYVFTRQPSYFFDLDSVRQPHTSRHQGKLRPDHVRPRSREIWRGPNGDDASGLELMKARGIVGHPLGKNPGDVWQLASSGYRSGHHATFPIALPERAISAGCPEARCVSCRLPWRRQLIRSLGGTAVRGALGPSCGCDAPSEPGLVLDPFFGAGTTAVAAERLQRDWLGIELNPAFAELANRRIQEARAGPAQRAA